MVVCVLPEGEVVLYMSDLRRTRAVSASLVKGQDGAGRGVAQSPKLLRSPAKTQQLLSSCVSS